MELYIIIAILIINGIINYACFKTLTHIILFLHNINQKTINICKELSEMKYISDVINDIDIKMEELSDKT